MSIKLCRDCEHQRFWPPVPEGMACATGYWICMRPGVPVEYSYVDKVTGEQRSRLVEKVFCETEREYGYIGSRLVGACGEEARFFQPRVKPTPPEGV